MSEAEPLSRSRRIRRFVTDAAVMLTGLLALALIVGSLIELLGPGPYRQKFWAIALLIFLPLLLLNTYKYWQDRRRRRKLSQHLLAHDAISPV